MRFISAIVFFSFIFSPVYAAGEQAVDDVSELCQHIQDDKDDFGIRSVASADYVPGVDVHGNKVASADVDGQPSSFLPDPIIIPIELDVLGHAGVHIPADLYSDTVLAEIKVYRNGAFVFGDKDIRSQVKSFCDNPIQEHGQKDANPLPSSDKIEGQFP